MKNFMLICLITAIVLLSACAKSTPTGSIVQDITKQDSTGMKSGQSQDSTAERVDQSQDGTTTITTVTDEGKQVTEVTTGKTGDWCQEGSTWTSSGAQGDYKWVVKGIQGSGKYAGYCHVTYDMNAQGTKGNVDVYYKEDGSGYQIMNINGQTYESAWHK